MASSSALVTPASRDHSSESLGAKLRHLRTARELTIAQLAKRAGVSSGLISQIVVDGFQPNPSFAPDAFTL